eukprot:g18265.t1
MASGRCVGSICGLLMLLALGQVMLLFADNSPYAWLVHLNWMLLLGVWCLICMVSIPTGYAYWTCYIRPTHERFLPASVVDCPGWQFFLGCCGCFLLGDALDCCAPCALAALTSGLGFLNQEGSGRSGMGSLVPFRERFSMESSSGTFCMDCCLWTWCLPCQATRLSGDLRSGGTLWEARVPVRERTMVVGQPVTVQAEAAEPKAKW